MHISLTYDSSIFSLLVIIQRRHLSQEEKCIQRNNESHTYIPFDRRNDWKWCGFVWWSVIFVNTELWWLIFSNIESTCIVLSGKNWHNHKYLNNDRDVQWLFYFHFLVFWLFFLYRVGNRNLSNSETLLFQ